MIARLDRLARNLHFVSSLQERGVDFVAADMPDANRLTIHIIASVAEVVGRTISENTKNALATAKARGVKLGNPNGARALRGKQTGNAEAVAALNEAASQKAADLKGIVDEIRRGITTTRGIADELHMRGIRAPRGDVWHPTAVSRLLARLDTAARRTRCPGNAPDLFRLGPTPELKSDEQGRLASSIISQADKNYFLSTKTRAGRCRELWISSPCPPCRISRSNMTKARTSPHRGRRE